MPPFDESNYTTANASSDLQQSIEPLAVASSEPLIDPRTGKAVVSTPPDHPKWKPNKAMLWTGMAILFATTLVILLILLVSVSRNNAAKDLDKQTYPNTNIPLTDLTVGDPLTLGQIGSLDVNGTVTINGGVVLVPTTAPTNPSTGQLFTDKTTNSLNYFDGSLTKAVAMLGDSITNVTGRRNQITATKTGTDIALSLPQDIATNSTPTFADLILKQALSILNGGTGATTAEQARKNLGAAALSDIPTFPTGNFINLAPNTPQTDSSTNTSIHINKTNAGNLMNLQSNANDVLTVSNTGQTTLQNSTDSTNAFQVQNAIGQNILQLDTQNMVVKTGSIVPLVGATFTPKGIVYNTIEGSAGWADANLAIGSDGNARLSYYADGNMVLKYARCTDADCTAKVTADIHNSVAAAYPYSSAIALDSNDFAHVAYLDYSTRDLIYTRCTDADCTIKNNTTIDSVGSVGYFTTLVFGDDGFARMTYYDATSDTLKYGRCTNSDCTTKNITSIDNIGGGVYTGTSSLVIGSDGFARVSYRDGVDQDLKYARCTDADCITKNITIVDAFGDVGAHPSTALDSNGFPLIAYFDWSNEDLKYARCTDIDCTAKTISTVDSAGNVGWVPALIVGTDGYPRIAYTGNTYDVMLAQCTNMDCTASIKGSIDSVHESNMKSLVIAPDGNPRIAYLDGDSKEIIFARFTSQNGIDQLSGPQLGSTTASYGTANLRGITLQGGIDIDNSGRVNSAAINVLGSGTFIQASSHEIGDWSEFEVSGNNFVYSTKTGSTYVSATDKRGLYVTSYDDQDTSCSGCGQALIVEKYGTGDALYVTKAAGEAGYLIRATQDYGAEVFTIDPIGITKFTNSTNSTTAFQIQNSAGSSLLTVNTATAGGSTILNTTSATAGATVVSIAQSGTVQGTITVNAGTVSYNAFTGSHYASLAPGQTEPAYGTLMTLAGNSSERMNDNGELIYVVATAQTPNDPKAFGSFNGQTDGGNTERYGNGGLYLVAASGNGDLWVADNGTGNITAGDQLMSSTIPGHAMKDPGTYPTSHIVAKAAQSIDWSKVTTTDSNGTKVTKLSVFFTNYDKDNTMSILQGSNPTNTTLTIQNLDIAGNLNVNGLTTLKELKVTGSSSFEGTLVVTTIHVSDITISGKITTAGDTPTAAVGVAAGIINGIIAPTVTVEGNDTAGLLTIKTGSNSNVGELAKIAFSSAYKTRPIVNLTPGNNDASSLKYYYNATTYELSILTSSAPADNTAYTFSYWIVQ